MCTAGAKLIPRKRHTKLTAFVARVSKNPAKDFCSEDLDVRPV
jgi:hypothetical protein